jgi:RNA polymerase sigma-70 factor, ECF subfamily
MATELSIDTGPTADDKALVRAVLKGSDSAFEAIFHRHGPRLWNFACALSDHQFDDAQDLVQETFLRAHHRLHTLRSPAALGSWLATLMRRLATNRRTRTRHRADLLGAYPVDDPLASSGYASTPEEAYLSRELGAAIDSALGQLTLSSRRIFTAFHVDGQSIAEISAATGLSVGAVKARLFQSRQKLKKELETMAPEATLPREMPESLNIVLMGSYQHENDPLHPHRLTRQLLPRRLLFACRKTPQSAAELAQCLHADQAYVEDILPDLVSGELLEEVFPGRYRTDFLFTTKSEFIEVVRNIPFIDEGVEILRKNIPRLKKTLEETSLIHRQGHTWSQLSWIALPVWITSRGLGRQIDRSPEWSKHRIWVYPIRPVDFWHLLGLADLDQQDALSVDARSTEGDTHGMAFAQAVANLGHEARELIDFNDLDRYIGRLSRGPLTEEQLLEGARHLEEEKEKLARYIEREFIRPSNSGKLECAVPIITAEDDAKLIDIVDEICAELAEKMLVPSLSAFVQQVEDLGFQHLLAQPHYLGFLGSLIANSQLVRSCVENHLLTPPEKSDPTFGYWAWHDAPNLMKSWSKGR